MKFASPILALAATLASTTAASPASAPAAAAAASNPTFFLIRHAEKNSDGTISSRGEKRAQCLIKVFGRDSQYNIRSIFVQTPHSGGKWLYCSYIV